MSTTKNFVINAALLAVLVVAMAYVGPELDAQSEHVQQAIDAQQQERRFTKAVQEMCGPNAAWREQEDGSIRCYLHTGKKTNTIINVSQL